MDLFSAFPQLFTELIHLSDGEDRIYLVGGAPRDYFLKKPIRDFDFVVRRKAKNIGKRLADALNGDFYMLDEERQTARVIVHSLDGTNRIIDIASFRGNNLEEDLRNRDFTINSMAVDISHPDRLHDPLGGLRDIQLKVIRHCSETSFQDDPLRILRAARMAVNLGFVIEPITQKSIRRSVPMMHNITAERQRDEIFRFLEGKSPDVVLRLLDHLNVIGKIFPQLTPLKGLEQSSPHRQDAWEHTLTTIREMDVLFSVLVDKIPGDMGANLRMASACLWLGRHRARLAEHFSIILANDRSIKGLLFLAGLFHDVAKPKTMRQDESGTIQFLRHESLGALTIGSLANQLALAGSEEKRLETLVGNHMRVHWLAARNGEVTRRSIYRFFRDSGDAGLDLCLLALADLLAIYGHSLTQEKWLGELKVCRNIMDCWFERNHEVVKPPRLLDGDDLQEKFFLPPGPLIGELLESVYEAQAAGEISTTGQAMDWVRSYLASRP